MSAPTESPIEPEIEPESVEPEIEPEEPGVELDIEPETTEPPVASAQPLMEILPADFPLPVLIRFVPDVALRKAVADAATYALSIDVTGPEGLQRADLAVTTVRTAMKKWEDSFEEPTSLANRLHKYLTGARGEGLDPGAAAIKTVGQRIYAEKQRLENIERERLRKEQEEADRQAREQARKEREAAERAKAPAPVVEALKAQEETATAPPVPSASAALTKMRGSSVVTTWKARIAGTPAIDEPNPSLAELTPTQQAAVMELFKAVVAGTVPMSVFELNWSLLNSRAKSEKATFALPGMEAFEVGSIRAKAAR